MADRKLRIGERRLKEIRALAASCLQQIGCAVAPVPVEAVAAKLGANVLRAPYEGDNFAGMLIARGGSYVIAVNSNNHQNRQRFTIAHECGHLLLAHKLGAHVDEAFVINRNERSSDGTDMQEVEANQFAAELLMPLRFLLRDINSVDFESDDDVRTLADKYRVSPTAMTFRLANVFL